MSLPRTMDAPLQRSRGLARLGAWLHRLLGWRIAGALPALPKYVIIVAPHSSNWDFIVAVAAKWRLGLAASFLVKDASFRVPVLGAFLRAAGGIPVDRSVRGNVVEQAIRAFAARDRFVLAIAPEGTRRKVDRWRTGFYHTARGAGVPIVGVELDWGRRVLTIHPPFETTADAAGDLAALQALFAGARRRGEG